MLAVFVGAVGLDLPILGVAAVLNGLVLGVALGLDLLPLLLALGLDPRILFLAFAVNLLLPLRGFLVLLCLHRLPFGLVPALKLLFFAELALGHLVSDLFELLALLLVQLLLFALLPGVELVILPGLPVRQLGRFVLVLFVHGLFLVLVAGGLGFGLLALMPGFHFRLFLGLAVVVGSPLGLVPLFLGLAFSVLTLVDRMLVPFVGVLILEVAAFLFLPLIDLIPLARLLPIKAVVFLAACALALVVFLALLPAELVIGLFAAAVDDVVFFLSLGVELLVLLVPPRIPVGVRLAAASAFAEAAVFVALLVGAIQQPAASLGQPRQPGSGRCLHRLPPPHRRPGR